RGGRGPLGFDLGLVQLGRPDPHLGHLAVEPLVRVRGVPAPQADPVRGCAGHRAGGGRGRNADPDVGLTGGAGVVRDGDGTPAAHAELLDVGDRATAGEVVVAAGAVRVGGRGDDGAER